MNYSWTFGDLQKEYFQLRGELQNGSITGVNTDERDLCKKFLNREQRHLASFRPPFLQSQWSIRLQADIALQDSDVDSVTGSKNRPRLVDTGANLKGRDLFRVVSDGTYRRTVIGIDSTTYQVDEPLFETATTGDSWVAYKKHYPLPPDFGEFHSSFYEDGEREIRIVTTAELQQLAKRGNSESMPRVASVGIFTNRFDDYQAQETSVTVANDSRIVTTSDATAYDLGDIALINDKHLHTIKGLSTTTNEIWLDRSYTGTTTCATLTQNPKGATEYLTFHRMPTEEKEIILEGYVKPQDMVADTDRPIIPDTLVPALIVGALLRDKIGREELTQAWVAYYDKVLRELKKGKNAKVFETPPPRGWRNNASSYDWSATGLS